MSSIKPLHNDRDLVAMLRQGEERGMEQLFARYYSTLCQSAYYLLKARDDAEDIVQDVFQRIWSRRDQLREDVDIKPYLLRAVRNACLNHLKVANRYQGLEEEVFQLRTATFLTADNQLAYQELSEKIMEAIERLPPKCREVFVLSRMEEKSQKEIAEQMGISVKTVENQMTKALRNLRADLEPYLKAILLLLGVF